MNIPHPSLPEHDLIRSAAPEPQLSAGLKQRVLQDCAAQARLARLQFRVRIGISSLVVCGLLFALLARPTGPEIASPDIAEESLQPTPRSPGYSRADGGSGFAGHQVTPDNMPVPQDMQQINEMIDERVRRNQLLECALLPFL